MQDLSEAVQGSWRRFLEQYEPLRPELYRYCRHLTGSPWEAEDVVQDALSRAFVTLGCLREPPTQPRAWLFRVATNLFINQRLHFRERLAPAELPEPALDTEPRAPREAAGTLLCQLSPQERAAVVLKDVFDFSLSEVAQVLTTTPGAIKAALHRGRGKLKEPDTSAHSVVTPHVLDQFCDAFNRRDIDRLTALLLDSASVELPGLVIEQGPAAAKSGTFRGTLFGCPQREHSTLPQIQCQLVAHRGEPLLLWWRDGAVHTIVRAVVTDDRIAKLTSYYHAPEVISEICRELNLPCQTHGYHYWQAGGES